MTSIPDCLVFSALFILHSFHHGYHRLNHQHTSAHVISETYETLLEPVFVYETKKEIKIKEKEGSKIITKIPKLQTQNPPNT